MSTAETTSPDTPRRRSSSLMIGETEFRKVPIERLTEYPRSSDTVYKDRWWVVTADECALFYVPQEALFPQCNKNEEVAKVIGAKYATKLSKPIGLVFIETAFVPQRVGMIDS